MADVEQVTSRSRYPWVWLTLTLLSLYFLSKLSDTIVHRIYVPKETEPGRPSPLIDWNLFWVDASVFFVLLVTTFCLMRLFMALRSYLRTYRKPECEKLQVLAK